MTLARVQRRLLQAAAIVIFLVLAGATYQGVATALERREFPHPGRLVDVGGHQLHLYCTGEGAPTVVLEAPAAGMSAAWALDPAGDRRHHARVQLRPCGPRLERGRRRDHSIRRRFRRSCRRSSQRAGERGPYVLAGHGLGAALALLDAQRFGDQAVALVMIDRPAGVDPSERARATRLVTMSPWLARTGVLRATTMLSAHAEGLPEPSHGALRAFLNRPDHLTRAARELVRWDDTVTLASAVVLPAHVRVTELGTGQPGGVDFLSDQLEAGRCRARDSRRGCSRGTPGAGLCSRRSSGFRSSNGCAARSGTTSIRR